MLPSDLGYCLFVAMSVALLHQDVLISYAGFGSCAFSFDYVANDGDLQRYVWTWNTVCF